MIMMKITIAVIRKLIRNHAISRPYTPEFSEMTANKYRGKTS